MVDVITCAIFGDCRLRGVGVVRGVSLPSPIDSMCRPYNYRVTVSVTCATNVQLEAEFMLWHQSAHYVGCLTRNSPRLHRFSAHGKYLWFLPDFLHFLWQFPEHLTIPWLFQFSRKSGNKSDYYCLSCPETDHWFRKTFILLRRTCHLEQSTYRSHVVRDSEHSFKRHL